MKLSTFLKDIGQPIPYYAPLARMYGVKGAVLLCRFIWWAGLQEDADGWIYKSQDDLLEETGMSHEEQATARKRLRKVGIVEERYQRIEHRFSFRINFEKLEAL